MKLSYRRFELQLAHRWAIASRLSAEGRGGTDTFKVVFVELTDDDGTVGLGEAAPSSRYQENTDSSVAFLEHVDPANLSFSDIPGSMHYLERIAEKNFAPKGALN